MSEHEEALRLLSERKFHPWEGGEGTVTGEWVHANLAIALRHFFNEQFATADRYLDAALTYPENLGEGKLPTIVDSELLYWKGRVQEALLQPAVVWFARGAAGDQNLTAAAYYNDQPPDAAFYQAACLHRLGKVDEARKRFTAMLNYARKHLHDHVEVDYFAVSLPDLNVFNQDLRLNHQIHCYYLLALGQLGMGATSLAQKSFGSVLSLDCCHAGALRHMQLLTQNHHLNVDSPNQPTVAQHRAE